MRHILDCWSRNAEANNIDGIFYGVDDNFWGLKPKGKPCYARVDVTKVIGFTEKGYSWPGECKGGIRIEPSDYTAIMAHLRYPRWPWGSYNYSYINLEACKCCLPNPTHETGEELSICLPD
jgi:hypothetical protein